MKVIWKKTTMCNTGNPKTVSEGFSWYNCVGGESGNPIDSQTLKLQYFPLKMSHF